MGESKRTVLVLGGSSGAGRAIALELARSGWAVGVAGGVPEFAEQTAIDIRQAGGQGCAFPVCLPREESIDALFAAFLARFGRLDGLVAAEMVDDPGSFLALPLEQWQRTLRFNVDGTILCCQQAARQMLAQGRENGPYSILLLLSARGCSQDGNDAAFCASNWALRGLMRHLARNLAAGNITVNALAWEQGAGWQGLAQTAQYLLSPQAANVTGMTLLDGDGALMA